MQETGYIRTEADMKYLILFILSTRPAVDEESLLAGILSDNCAEYVTYLHCMEDLLGRGFVARKEEEYFLTDTGKTTLGDLGKVLPSSVRRKAQDAVLLSCQRKERRSMIHTETVKNPENGLYTTVMSLHDEVGELFALRLTTLDREQGLDMEQNFTRDAECIYRRVLELLLPTSGE